MKRRGGGSIVLAIVIGVVGGAWLSELGPDHSQCSSALVAAANQSACSADSFRWYAAWGLIALAAIFAIKGLIDYAKSSSLPIRPCPECGTPVQAPANHCSNCGIALDTTH